MKRLSLFAFAFALFASLFAAPASAHHTPEQAAKSFYEWYLRELNAQHEPIRDDKQEIQDTVSGRLRRWLYSKSYEEYGADYFLDAQDYDENWANNISARKITLKGPKATVKLTMSVPKGTQSGFGARSLTIGMVNEGGAWKIDSVNNRPLIR